MWVCCLLSFPVYKDAVIENVSLQLVTGVRERLCFSNGQRSDNSYRYLMNREVGEEKGNESETLWISDFQYQIMVYLVQVFSSDLITYLL